jgi:signal transduction histidine kinase
MPTPERDTETARLRTLHEQGILDTPREPFFDDLAYLAAEVCATPVALVAFVDRHRVWFKARVGTEADEVSRAPGFFEDLIATAAPVVVPDMAADDRHAAESIAGPPIGARFLAGAPLTGAAGEVLGALVVADRVPRTLQEWQRGALHLLARMTAREQRERFSRRDADRRRLDAVGAIAGGLAHEFNNLLTVILGSGSLLESRLEPGDPRREDTRRILASAQRAAALTRQMLAVSGHRSLVPEVIDLNEIVARRAPEWTALPGDPVRLDLHLAPRLGRVKADRRQIELALRGLIDAAVETMPSGGTLRVATHELDAPAVGRPDGASLPPGRYVAVEVTDTAADGVPGPTRDDGSVLDSTIGRITENGVEPEFSLPVVHGIVAQSGGHLQVGGAAGGAAAFRILLPRLADAPA